MTITIFDRLIATHLELTARLANGVDVGTAEMGMIIDQGLAAAPLLSFIEDRQELRQILSIWASRFSRRQGYHPNIDFENCRNSDLPLLHSRSETLKSRWMAGQRWSPDTFDISIADLEKIEGGLPDLHRVIVIAHRAELPIEGLRRTAAANIKKGVKYDFVVSSSTVLHDAFHSSLIQALSAGDESPQDLIGIWRLSYEWTDPPFIFYHFGFLDDGSPNLLALRGDQRQEGLAERYQILEPAIAGAVLRAVMREAPKESQISELSGENSHFVSNNVVQLFTKTNHSR